MSEEIPSGYQTGYMITHPPAGAQTIQRISFGNIIMVLEKDGKKNQRTSQRTVNSFMKTAGSLRYIGKPPKLHMHSICQQMEWNCCH
jgi:hypothetical protein